MAGDGYKPPLVTDKPRESRVRPDELEDSAAPPDGTLPEPLLFLENLIHEQGDVAKYESPYGPVALFNHPDQVQTILRGNNFVRTSLLSLVLGQGLLASEGPYWRAQRRSMQPHFHEGCLRGFIPLITEATLALLRRWEEFGPGGEPLDLASEMRCLTLEVIVSTLFSVALEDDAAEWHTAISVLIEDLGAISGSQFNVPLKFTPSRHARFQRAMETINGKVQRIIDTRRALEDKPRDLLSTLLLARDEATGEVLTDRQVRDEVVTMLVAGHETSAIALCWICQALAEHPAVEERMISELEQVLQGRIPTAADLPQLSYTRKVFEETLRLYPPVWITARQTVDAQTVAGLHLPARMVVLISAFTTHRHPDFWEDPERFEPERFSPERSRGRHRYAYIPFAGGAHGCIGESFALLEVQVILGAILPKWRLRPAAGYSTAIETSINLRHSDGFWVTLERRPAPLPA